MSNSVVQDEQPSVELHHLPQSWSWSCLGDVGLVRLGKTPRKTDYRDHGDYKIVKFRDVDETGKINWDNNEKGYVSSAPEILGTLQELREGDVLVTASAHMSEHIGKKVGIVLSVPRKYKKAFVVGELLRIRANGGVDPRWVFYYLGSAEGYKAIQRRVHGVHLIGSRAQHIEIPLAPPDDQQRVVAEIEKQVSRLDEAVANLKRVKANLKRYKASVLKAAVEGKLTEDWRKAHPDVEPASKLLERILAECRAKWSGKGKYKELPIPDTTILPRLPQTWAWSSVETICSDVVDCPHSTPKWQATGRVCLRTTEFRPGRLDLSDVRYVSLATYEVRIQRLTPRENDIVYSREGGILGLACMIPARLNPCLGQRMMLLRSHELFSPNLLMYWLNSPDLLARVRSLTGGSASPHLNVGEVKSFPVPVAPIAEQNAIIAEVERRLSVIEELEAAVEANLIRADRLRQSILGSAFSGRLFIKEAFDPNQGGSHCVL